MPKKTWKNDDIVTAEDLQRFDDGANDTVTQQKNGLMLAEDKVKLDKLYNYPEPTKANIENFLLDSNIKQGDFQWDGVLTMSAFLSMFFINGDISNLFGSSIIKLSKKIGNPSDPNAVHIVASSGAVVVQGIIVDGVYRLTKADFNNDSVGIDSFYNGSPAFKQPIYFTPASFLNARTGTASSPENISTIDIHFLANNLTSQIRTVRATGARSVRTHNGTAWSNWSNI